MFNNRSDLTAINSIEATRIQYYSFYQIFENCKNSLKTIGSIIADSIDNYALSELFKGCVTLTTVNSINVDEMG